MYCISVGRPPGPNLNFFIIFELEVREHLKNENTNKKFKFQTTVSISVHLANGRDVSVDTFWHRQSD